MDVLPQLAVSSFRQLATLTGLSATPLIAMAGWQCFLVIAAPIGMPSDAVFSLAFSHTLLIFISGSVACGLRGFFSFTHTHSDYFSFTIRRSLLPHFATAFRFSLIELFHITFTSSDNNIFFVTSIITSFIFNRYFHWLLILTFVISLAVITAGFSLHTITIDTPFQPMILRYCLSISHYFLRYVSACIFHVIFFSLHWCSLLSLRINIIDIFFFHCFAAHYFINIFITDISLILINIGCFTFTLFTLSYFHISSTYYITLSLRHLLRYCWLMIYNDCW